MPQHEIYPIYKIGDYAVYQRAGKPRQRRGLTKYVVFKGEFAVKDRRTQRSALLFAQRAALDTLT